MRNPYVKFLALSIQKAERGCNRVSIDYEAMERRILAQLDPDQKMDIHREWAAEQLGIDPADVTPKQREAAKRVRFAEMYGRPCGQS